jgi:hypothetical protein
MRVHPLAVIGSALVLAVAGALLVQARSGDDAAESSPPSGASSSPRMSVTADEVRVRAPKGTYVVRHVRPGASFEKPELLGAGSLVLDRTEADAGPPVVLLPTAAGNEVADVMVVGVTAVSRRGPRTQWLSSEHGVELVWDARGFSDWTIERNGNLVTKAADGHHVDPVPPAAATRYTISRVGDPTAYVAQVPALDDSLIGEDVTTIGALRSPAGVSPPGATVFATRRDACDDVLASPAQPVSERTADADRQHLTDDLMRHDDIRSVGMSSCGSQPVVVVGTKDLSASVPAQGPGGTPVIAYKQRPIYAF